MPSGTGEELLGAWESTPIPEVSEVSYEGEKQRGSDQSQTWGRGNEGKGPAVESSLNIELTLAWSEGPANLPRNYLEVGKTIAF